MLPGVAGPEHGRPLVAQPLVQRELDRLVRPVVRRVLHDLCVREVCERGVRDPVERLQRIVGVGHRTAGAADAIDPSVTELERDGVRARGPVRLERGELVVHLVQHEADARAQVFHDLALD